MTRMIDKIYLVIILSTFQQFRNQMWPNDDKCDTGLSTPIPTRRARDRGQGEGWGAGVEGSEYPRPFPVI
jgi:hypothetical protein